LVHFHYYFSHLAYAHRSCTRRKNSAAEAAVVSAASFDLGGDAFDVGDFQRYGIGVVSPE
jgi:hypothetical protein